MGVYEIPQLKKIEKYFKATVYYEDTLKHKPDPEPLLLAVRQLDVKPEEIVYIGDMESDIIAAKAAKTKAILYKKENVYNTQYWTAVFKEIPQIIAKI